MNFRNLSSTFATLMLFFLSMDSGAMYGDLLPLYKAPLHACHIATDLHGGTCSGTVMTGNMIKTASHCLRNKIPAEMTVTCPNGQKFEVEDIILHPEYYNTPNRMMADVGLIKIKGNYSHKIPAYLTQSKDIIEILKKSKQCAVWSYGYHIESLIQLGDYHGVALSQYELTNSHIVIPNSAEVMIRSGDSGGGLYCLDQDNLWVNLGTVYGHDYEVSFILRNDYIQDFLSSYGIEEREFNMPQESDMALDNNGNPSHEELSFQEGQSYKVKPFSILVDQNLQQYGIGDQLNVLFKVEEINLNKATGTLIIRDVAPTRYLCIDGILCNGKYENLTISLDRLNNETAK